MTLRDLLNDGIEIQGRVLVQCLHEDDTETLYEGESLYCKGDFLDRDVKYIYSNVHPIGGWGDTNPVYVAKLVIEIEEE